jgi:hypothetical protein
MNLTFSEETTDTSLRCRIRKLLALISNLMYVNCSHYWDSLYISVNNRNDVGAHKKGKEFTLRCVPIFTYKALMIAVFCLLTFTVGFQPFMCFISQREVGRE